MPVHNITNIHVLYSIDSAKLQLGVKPELRLSENQAPVGVMALLCGKNSADEKCIILVIQTLFAYK